MFSLIQLSRNFKEEQYITELQEMIPFESGLQSFLVLSASAKYEDMKQVLKQFSGVLSQSIHFHENG